MSEILNIEKWHHYNTTCVIYLNKEMSSRVHLFMDGENYIKCITTIYKHIDVYYVPIQHIHKRLKAMTIVAFEWRTRFN